MLSILSGLAYHVDLRHLTLIYLMQERPCTRCIKRNIGHLCHDEPRDADSKKARSTQGTSVIDESETRSEAARSSIDQTRAALRALGQSSQFRGSTPNLHQGDPLQQLVQRSQGIQSSALNSNLNPCALSFQLFLSFFFCCILCFPTSALCLLPRFGPCSTTSSRRTASCWLWLIRAYAFLWMRYWLSSSSRAGHSHACLCVVSHYVLLPPV